MSKFDILRKRFNQIPVGEKFDFMDLINDLGYSHTTVLGYRSNFETRGYMERVSVKLEGSRKIKITFKKIRDLYENVYELQEKKRKEIIEIMERKIGEIFNYQDNWYQCIENTGYGCIICHFNTHNNICCNLNIIGNCLPPYRKDYKSVVFRKLEKVGNPIMVENKSYQKIKVPDSLCNNCAFYDNFSRNCKLSYYINHQPAYSCLKDEIFVEIKQNKEDMKEKKLNLKEFNLEAAKAGKPVCTRDGRKARIICFDLNNKNFPIVAIINCDTEENAYQYDIDGICDEHDNNLNLMMSSEKKEGWVIIHKEAIYDKETAEKIARETTANVIKIQKIEWGE